MGLAARILEQEPTGKFRHMIHDEVDKWVDQIIDEVFEDGTVPDILRIQGLSAAKNLLPKTTSGLKVCLCPKKIRSPSRFPVWTGFIR